MCRKNREMLEHAWQVVRPFISRGVARYTMVVARNCGMASFPVALITGQT